MEQALKEDKKVSFLQKEEEVPLDNEEWVKVSRENIQGQLKAGLMTNNPHKINALIISLKDYQHMAQIRGIDEWSFVEGMLVDIAKSNLRKPILGMLEGSLWEIKMVREIAKEFDNEIKTKGMWPQVDLQKLDQTRLSFITNSNLAILFLISPEEPIVETDFFSEKPGTPPERLASLQRMYEQMIQVFASVEPKNTLVRRH